MHAPIDERIDRREVTNSYLGMVHGVVKFQDIQVSKQKHFEIFHGNVLIDFHNVMFAVEL